MEENTKRNTEHKVYEFADEHKILIPVEDLYLVVNGKPFKMEGKMVKAEEIFIKMNAETGRIIGWSPLQDLELNEEGQFIANKNLVAFLTKDGAQIRIKKVRNRVIMFNDKEETDEVKKVFDYLLGVDFKEDVRKENALIQKLRDNEYLMLVNGVYTFMHKEKSEPYLFMEANNEMTLLEVVQVYENEDSVKYKIENQDKELIHDLKANSISVK